MEKEEFSDITISEIAAHADLDRRTFYRHFKTKEDVVAYYIQRGSEEYEIELKKNSVFDNKAIAKSFFMACYNQKEMLLILNKQKLSHFFLAELGGIFSRYQNKYASPEELEHSDKEYTLTYHIGGLWNLMMRWLSAGCNESPEEMAEIIVRIIQSGQI